MKYIYKMETVLVTLTAVLCTILIYKLLYKLRSILPWRVNCWFCNSNSWMKYVDRNSWTCPSCEQYNGFTKDGDYNKQITGNGCEQVPNTPKVFQKSPPKNGLCKMCNINQQLKVTQLANFVPMNDMKFDEEIESYRMQLEKAYKLCSPCKKVVQMKLHKEKETFLGSKLLENRTPEKKNQKHERQNHKLRNLINNTSMLIAVILQIVLLIELYRNMMKYKNLISTINNIQEVLKGILERIYDIVKMKTLMTFPSIENYLNDINNVLYTDLMPKSFNFRHGNVDHLNMTAQKVLGGFVCFIQILGHVWSINSLRHTIVIDLLWSVFVITSIANHSVAFDPIFMSIIKLSSIIAVLLVYGNMKTKTVGASSRTPTTPKKMKKITNATMCALLDDDDNMTLDTDDDVSLSKFGLHNFSESSNETMSPLNASLLSGRSFTPRSDSIWTKPKLNSTFCVNSMISKSPSSVSDTVFVKPSFNKYQKLTKDDSDSDLDESISSLCISSPKKSKMKNNSIFSLRKFTATPNFVAPTPISRSRPLISPSKLGHSTSWVAGGYWGTEGERQIFNIDGSRSSSQSSGFESQASSMNQRNVFSQPPSREESICGEPMVLDRFPNMSNLSSYQSHNNFSRVSSPVFPQMQFNGHVHIPQPRFAQQNSGPNVFLQQPQYVQNSMFKAPGGSGLFKLPQDTNFTSR